MLTRLYSFVAIILAAGLLFTSKVIQLPGSQDVTTFIGPRTWPLAVLIMMLVLAVGMVLLLWAKGPGQFTGLSGEADTARPEAASDEAVTRDDAGGHRWRHLVIFGLAIAYTVLMAQLGYLIATALFAALCTVSLGERRPLHILLNTLIAMLIVSVVFNRLLSIPLP